MILLAALLVAPLAPGCRRVDSAIQCALAPPIRIVPPPVTPPSTAPAEAKSVRRQHRSAPVRSSRKPDPAPRPPTPAEITRHAGALVTIGDCTGARTYLTAMADAAAADRLYRSCLGLPTTAASGGDLGAVPGEAAPALRGAEPAQHP